MNTPNLRTMPAGEPFDRLATALLALLDSARPADPQGDRLAGWKPVRGECHDNVDRWVALYPEARAVRGWRHEDFNGVTHKFVAHSAIRTAGGLVDVTLPCTEPARPFIEHPREVLNRDRVLNLVRGRSSFAFDRAVDLQLSRLRRKLTAAHGEAGNLFRTVRNEGYIFVSAVRRI